MCTTNINTLQTDRQVFCSTNDNSGLQAAFANELYVDGGVVKIRKKDNQAKVKRT